MVGRPSPKSLSIQSRVYTVRKASIDNIQELMMHKGQEVQTRTLIHLLLHCSDSEKSRFLASRFSMYFPKYPECTRAFNYTQIEVKEAQGRNSLPKVTQQVSGSQEVTRAPASQCPLPPLTTG